MKGGGKYIFLLLLLVLLTSIVTASDDAPPALPSEYWGLIGDGSVADGLTVTAEVNGVNYAQTSTTLDGYYDVILVDGDRDLTYNYDPTCAVHEANGEACVPCIQCLGSNCLLGYNESTCIEGPQDGSIVTIKINGNIADPTVNWNNGSINRADITLIIIVEIPLESGYNLISFSVIPLEDASNITGILDSINGNYSILWAYYANDSSDPWKSYNPALPPFLNDLKQIDTKHGYWLKMITNDDLIYQGFPVDPSNYSIPLVEGYNLIGMPYVNSKNYTLPDVLNSISGSYSIVWGYKANDTSDPWKSYNPALPPFLNDLTVMDPEYGYWVKMVGLDTLTIS